MTERGLVLSSDSLRLDSAKSYEWLIKKCHKNTCGWKQVNIFKTTFKSVR